MEKEYLLTSDEKLKWWGDGEWVGEPDLVKFNNNGIDCLIIRIACPDGPKGEHIFGGHLCGYCKVPDNHECHGKDYDDFEIDVHGGLTYGEMNENNHHYIKDMGHWIGFDCAHSGDVVPSMKHFRETNKEMIKFIEDFPKPFNYPMFKDSYKNLEFCIEECKSMSNQLLKDK